MANFGLEGRVTIIAPGFVRDSRTKPRETNEDRHPDRRFVRMPVAEDVAALARFLASPAASMITGEMIQVRSWSELGSGFGTRHTGSAERYPVSMDPGSPAGMTGSPAGMTGSPAGMTGFWPHGGRICLTEIWEIAGRQDTWFWRLMEQPGDGYVVRYDL